MTTTSLFAHLSDDELIAAAKRLATTERQATAALVRSLMEVDARRLYLREGCSSLFTWCTQVLGLDDGAAYNRIEVARASRRVPALLETLDNGALTLASARLLAPHVTPGNCAGVLAAARHKSKRDVERLIAALAPQSDARPMIRRLPTPVAVAPVGSRAADATEPSAPVALPASPEGCEVTSPSAPSTVGATGSGPRPRPVIKPLSPGRIKLQLTISEGTHDKLRHAQELLRHAVPSGDLEAVLDRALTTLIEDLERRRFAATASPRTLRPSKAGSRQIPAAVRREVWRRDEGRCAFVGPHGRCTERGFLEFHHVQPYAAGGAATVENVVLHCKRHNQHEEALYFGPEGADTVREAGAAYLAV